MKTLTELQRTRFLSVASALYDNDCLPLCKWMHGEQAYDMLEHVKTTWGSRPLPILYEDYYEPLSAESWVMEFVLKGEIA